MTKFTPKTFSENVNVSKVSPKREFVVLLGGMFALFVIAYFVLGIILNVLIDRMPAKLENSISRLIKLDRFQTPPELEPLREEAQHLLDDLIQHLPDDERVYTIRIVDSDDVNALALPGGNIILLKGLIDEVESENELTMVMAHELGHYANKDHLRQMGRGIVFIALSVFLFGIDSGVTDLISGALTTLEYNFSREQEADADRFALNLLHKKYGHVGGATEFFKRIRKKEKLPEFVGIMSTHPVSSKRVELLENLILQLNYSVLDKKSLDPVFKNERP